MSATIETVPRGAILAGATLMLVAIAAAGAARLGLIDRVAVQPSAVVESRDLRFEDAAGAVLVLAADDGREVARLAPGTNGFTRGVLRGLARERRMNGAGAEPPFRLERRADGLLLLVDPATGREIELGAFGPTNAEAFARLLHTGEKRT